MKPNESRISRPRRLIGGPISLTLGSTRWAAPTLFYMFWFGLSMSGRATIMEISGMMYLAMIPTATWIGHVVNGADDQRHREMHVAAAGSHERVSLYRATAAFVAMAALGLASLLLALPQTSQRHMFGQAAVVMIAAALTGVSLSIPFSAPITEETAVAVGSGLLGFFALVLFPPLQWSVRQVNADRGIGALALLAGALLAATTSTIVTRWMYRHRLLY